MVCKGKCDFLIELYKNYRAGIWHIPNASYCRECEKHLITPNLRCMCCNNQLSKAPRTKYSKERLNELKIK